MKSKILLSLLVSLMVGVFVSSFVFAGCYTSSDCKSNEKCIEGYSPKADTMNCKCPEDNSKGTCKSAFDKGKACTEDTGCSSGDCNKGLASFFGIGTCASTIDAGQACHDSCADTSCDGWLDGICNDYVDGGIACHDSCSVSACIGQVDGTCSTYQCNPYNCNPYSCDLGPGSSTNGYGSECYETCYETCGGETCWNDGGCATGTTCVGGKDGVCESVIDKGKTCWSNGGCDSGSCNSGKDGKCRDYRDAGKTCLGSSCSSGAKCESSSGVCADYNDAGWSCDLQIFSGCKGGCSGKDSNSYICACNNAYSGKQGTCVPSFIPPIPPVPRNNSGGGSGGDDCDSDGNCFPKPAEPKDPLETLKDKLSLKGDRWSLRPDSIPIGEGEGSESGLGLVFKITF